MDIKRFLESYGKMMREIEVLRQQQEICRCMQYGLPLPEGCGRLLEEDVIDVRSLLIEACITWGEAAAELGITRGALYKKLTGLRRLRPDEKDILTRMAKKAKERLEAEWT